MKKIISILLAVIVTMTMAFTTVAAESNTSIKLEADKTEASVGDIITVSVTTPENSDLCVLSYYISYNTSSFEYVENSIKLNKVFPMEASNQIPGLIKYAGISADQISDDASVVFTFQLKVLNSGELSSQIIEAYTCDEYREETDMTKVFAQNSTPSVRVTVDGIIPTDPETPTDPVEPEIPEEPVEPETPEEPEVNASVRIIAPTEQTIKYKNEAVLSVEISGDVSDGTYIEWTADNGNFKTTQMDDSLKITSDKKGYTTFTATLFDKDGNVLATDAIEMYSKAGFFDKLIWFFTNLF